MDWQREAVLKLIQLLKQSECLWNSKCATFRNREDKKAALSMIAESLGTDVSEIEKKIHVIKSQYRREQLKLKTAAPKSGERALTSLWYAYKPLEFLDGSTSQTCDMVAPVSRNYVLLT